MITKFFCCIGFILQAGTGEMGDAKEIASQAGKVVLEIRDEGRLEAKDVLLPNGKKIRQTNADLEASRYIADELSRRYPAYGIISQDHMDKDPNWYEKDFVWIINPIDGTKNLESGSDDFQIQIGLLDHDESVLGVVYYPAKKIFVFAKKGEGAWVEEEGVKKRKRLMTFMPHENVLIRSSSFNKIEPHLAEWGWVPYEVIDEYLSSTTRLLKIIEGEASLYISLGASFEGTEKRGGVWNYGANVVIAREAGLILRTLSGEPLNLRQPQAFLTEGVVMTSDPEVYSAVIETDWHLSCE